MKNKELKELLNLYSDDADLDITDPGSLYVRDVKKGIKYVELLHFGSNEKEPLMNINLEV